MLPMLADVCFTTEGLGIISTLIFSLWVMLVWMYQRQIQTLESEVRYLRSEVSALRDAVRECEEERRRDDRPTD